MGVVWRARDERLERVVAVKQLLMQPGLTEDQKQDARRRALREARIAARLHHPNAIVVFDVAEHDGDPCLVMEYMAANSLSVTLAEKGSMSAADVAAMGSQIASALSAAHASGIVHRDVKPGNILINGDGVAKITDFGIARASGDVTVTQTGMFAGTPAYLAPEVARGQDPTPASDVFSFGATLYDAVEGGPPFPERQNQLALLRLVAEGKVQPPRQAGMLTALLMQLLRSEPDERPTMAEASQLLAELAGTQLPRPIGLGGKQTATKPGLAPLPDPNESAPAEAPAPVVVAEPVVAGPAPTAVAPMLLSDRPAAYRPANPAKPPASAGQKRLLLVGAVVLVLVVVVVGIVLAMQPSNGNAGGGGGPTQSNTGTTTQHQSPPDSNGSTGPSDSTSTAPTSPSEAKVTDWGAAGQLVVNFFNGLPGNAAAAFAMLSPAQQQAYGGLSGFQSYWGQFSSVGGRNARGLYNDTDGSVIVPAFQVSFTTGTGQTAVPGNRTLQVRVISLNGQLLIDSATKVN